MKLKTFTVTANIPERLNCLLEIAFNLWWTWNPEAIDLFRRVDHHLWSSLGHNPVALLANVNQQRLETLAKDSVFIAHLDRVKEALDEYMGLPTWADTEHPEFQEDKVAYFSMEFGLHECLPVYSGGLGVLAGDHFKSASELGLPMVGVGLLYHYGYFHQYLTQDGWQQEKYLENILHELPMRLVKGEDGTPLRVYVEIDGSRIAIQGWRVQVGRAQLYLLDTRIEGNDPSSKALTKRLYDSGDKVRVRQEMVLGIGGIRFLRALGIEPAVCHMNEGHAAFLGLERLRVLVSEKGLALHEAVEAVRAGNVFTTHTPVPAGIDLFPEDVIQEHFKNFADELRLTVHDLMTLGRQAPFNTSEPLSMAVLAISLSGHRNGVSRLHGKVSREMWKKIWTDLPTEEVPISHVTNGIHVRSWLSDEMARLFDRYIGPNWAADPLDHEIWSRVEQIPDNEIWRAKERLRERLVGWVRRVSAEQCSRRGANTRQIQAAQELLDPEILTIGFARRFATYKRGALLLRDLDRFLHMVSHPTQPVQFIFAGKAHPADDQGKHLIQDIFQQCRRPELQNRLVFIEDYDIDIARYLVQGVDVWLNTPRRPHEASGTSGMKVCPNGGIHLSVLDGWWDEAYTPEVGWAIGHGEVYDDPNLQDEIEANALYDLIENEIAPLYYDRGEDGLPRYWIEKMKASIQNLTPVFNTNRMLREYTEQQYLPALEIWRKLSADNYQGARMLSHWRKEVEKNWHTIEVFDVEIVDRAKFKFGDNFGVVCKINAGMQNPESIKVEVYHGKIDENAEIQKGRRTPLAMIEKLADDTYKYSGEITCDECGKFGITVIAYPYMEGLSSTFDMGLIAYG
jgi:starch phosphorylase